jgi:hypothetical protein
MNLEPDRGTLPGRSLKRLMQSAERLVKSGRLSSEEAIRLRAADDAGEADAVVSDIRVRHAQASLQAAVEEGAISSEDAEGLLARVRAGEHSAALRSHIKSFRRSRRRPAGQTETQDPGRQDHQHPAG